MGPLTAAAALVVVAALPVLAGDRLGIRLPANGDAALTWTLGDGVVPISKGSGADPDALSVRFEITAAGATSELVAGPGAAGWPAVSATRARFRDRSADAPVRATVIREGRKIKFSSRNPGPVMAALAAGPPGEPVAVRYRVSNVAEQIDHCVVYPTCTYVPFGGGAFRLDCRDAVADPTCGGTVVTTTSMASIPSTSTTSVPTTTSTSSTAIPGPCGDGVRNVGESCDGGAYCTADCTVPSASPGCCQDAEASCRPANGFVLFFNLYSFCGGTSFEAAVRGGVCSVGGTCEVLPIDDVPLCCQLTGSCSSSTANDTGDLWNFRNLCEGAQGGTVVHAAACGPTDTCQPG
jgi:hypothetical protein